MCEEGLEKGLAEKKLSLAEYLKGQENVRRHLMPSDKGTLCLSAFVRRHKVPLSEKAQSACLEALDTSSFFTVPPAATLLLFNSFNSPRNGREPRRQPPPEQLTDHRPTLNERNHEPPPPLH
jgi:hypothetical protein